MNVVVGKYQYRFAETDSWEDHETSPITGQELAEDLCESKDNLHAEYPDFREVWIKTGTLPARRFSVYAETSRSYQAHSQVPNPWEPIDITVFP